jgi:hypothetical protein
VVSGQFSGQLGLGLGARRRNELGCGCGHCFEGFADGGGEFAAGGLSFAEADDSAIELAFDGGHVAEQSFEAFRLSVADENFERAVFQYAGFVPASSLQAPEAGSDFGDELGFESAVGRVLGDELVVEAIEIGLAFATEDDGFRREPMLQTIHAGDGFAGLSAWAGCVCRVVAMAGDGVLIRLHCPVRKGKCRSRGAAFSRNLVEAMPPNLILEGPSKS